MEVQMTETEREELGYAGGKPTWLIIIVLIAMVIMFIGYSTKYFFPDLSNWLEEGADPDKIIWQVEKGE